MDDFQAEAEQELPKYKIDDLFLQWWKSQSFTTETDRARMIARVAFEAGMLTRPDSPVREWADALRRVLVKFHLQSKGHLHPFKQCMDEPCPDARLVLDHSAAAISATPSLAEQSQAESDAYAQGYQNGVAGSEPAEDK